MTAAPQLRRQRGRRLRFALLEHAALPLAAPLCRGLVASWRFSVVPESAPGFAALAAAPRAVIGVCHGMLFHALAAARLPLLRQRRIVVLLGPSRDGRLLAALLARFGIDHAVGATGARGVAGGHDLVRRVAAGDLGVVGIDGPRGPRGRVTPGWLRLAAAADAVPFLLVTSAAPGYTFASWDRAHLPAPGARIRGWFDNVAGADLAEVQRRMDDVGRRIGSAVLAP